MRIVIYVHRTASVLHTYYYDTFVVRRRYISARVQVHTIGWLNIYVREEKRDKQF